MDPAYIAQQVKYLRKRMRLTQENLAEAAGLSTRTIEKVESGRHRPEERTLRSLARAFKIDISYLEKPSPEQEAKQRAEFERALRKMVLVPTEPIRTTSEFMNAFAQRHASRFDLSATTNEETMAVAVSLTDLARGMTDVWDDCSMSDRLSFARDFVELCEELEAQGFLCHMGSNRQVLREKGRPDLVFDVGVLSFQPKSNADGKRYALITLEGNWETIAEDRAPLDGETSMAAR
jgi:transcriptional regulator with XRE-family HTH domain